MPNFLTPGPVNADVLIVSGRLTVTAGDRVDSIVTITASDPTRAADVSTAEGTEVELIGSILTVKAPHGFWRGGIPKNGSIDVHIELPTGSDLTVRGAMVSLRATGRLGRCSVRSASGDIHLEDVQALQVKTARGDIDATHVRESMSVLTGSGEVRVGTADADVALRSANGDIRVGSARHDLSAKAANGNVWIDDAYGNTAITTANGDVRLNAIHGNAVVDTARGDVSIGLAEGITAMLAANARRGRIRNDLQSSATPAAGLAPVHIRARTAFGDIHVHRSTA